MNEKIHPHSFIFSLYHLPNQHLIKVSLKHHIFPWFSYGVPHEKSQSRAASTWVLQLFDEAKNRETVMEGAHDSMTQTTVGGFVNHIENDGFMVFFWWFYGGFMVVLWWFYGGIMRFTLW